MKKINIKSGYLVLAMAGILLLAIVVYPLAKIVLQSFIYDGQLSVRNYYDAIRDRGFLASLKNSLFISFLSMAGAVLSGSFFAWVIGRTDIPMKGFFRTALVMPFIIPPFVGAIAWMQLLGPVGFLNRFYMHLTGSQVPLWNIYGPDGIILLLVIHLYPLVYINMLGSLERMNPELEEAAQISGSRIFSVMGRITLPLMLPALASGAVLVFIMAIANFGIPAILGFAENYYVLTTRIYEAITRSAKPNSLSLAASISMLLAVVAAGGLLFQRFYLAKKEYAVLTGKSIQPNIIRLGKHKYWIFTVCLLFVVFTSVAPLAAIVLTSLTRVYGLPPSISNLTFENFYNVFVLNLTVKRSIRNSLFLSFTAATFVSVLGSLIAYVIVKTKVKGRYIIEVISNTPYALPGTVIGLAMILAWLKPLPVIGVRLYNTIWILLVAYIAHYLAYGVRTTSASLTQVHESLEEAARISGAGWLRTYLDIVIPLILPGLFAGWFMVFIPTLRELTISALLWSTRNETIGVMVFNLLESGNTVASAALAVLMILVLVFANIITRKLTRGRVGY